MSAFPELHRLYSQTLDLGGLNCANWDGGESLPIDPHSIGKGLQFLETLSLFLIPSTVEPRPNGRIQYRWSNEKGDLLLEINPHRDRYIYQFIPLHFNQPSSPLPVTSIAEFLYQILIPYLLPTKPIIDTRQNRVPNYQDNLPNPL